MATEPSAGGERDEIAGQLPSTIAQLPFFTKGRFPRPDLLGRCEGERIVHTSSAALVDEVRDLSLGLGTLGMTRGSRVALLSESRPDWLVADLAILVAGAVTVPIYPTLSAEQVAYILRDAEVTVAIASTDVQYRKIREAAPTLPSLHAIVVLDPVATAGEPRPVPVHAVADVTAAGHRRLTDGWGVAREFQDTARAVQPSDLATIIYTSGTTAEPKGVMLTHGNVVANLDGIRPVFPISDEDVALSFLPLCHAFERMVSFVYLLHGISMVFAESIDTVARDLVRVRPTVMTGVPRVFEKLHARVHEKGRAAPGLKGVLFRWASGVASRVGRARTGGGRETGWLALEARLADRLVFRKIHEAVGGRLRFAVSGSAPLRSEIGEFFLGLGLPIIEGYGLTETAPVLTVMPMDNVRFGTVGRALRNVELRVAPDGEILARGPNVMAGYYNRPEETAAVLVGGWFHTGDVGTIDADGFLSITDRKKELILTSGGKKIAPQPIEAALRAPDFVAEAILIGEARHFPSALIVPDLAALARRLGVGPPGDRAAAEGLVGRDETRALVQAAVDSVNAGLAQFERIKRFALLTATFSVESGELTPTLKVKRRVVEERYREVIEEIYRQGGH
ncbi:MAG TPA: long-chain fatty acid--CoA ligase [Vicinamibacterales bacterium]|nr:long-chain fatty acid--CoA ligase [Vicinamibacterales bacterium]